ncbi:MAG TPA: cytochrome b5-like heme/steroid binding domain-containing protein [Candidatus Binatia bacterium]|nr:cytochrome b5-like heme/steroid binding domain-containing protein [Candidatus Binatia bacterium]
MMRTLYFSATLVFWLAVASFRIVLISFPGAEKTAAIAADKIISPAELARHALPSDCWMAIRGNVYDLTSYLPNHPSPPNIVLPWCGKDATEAYNTKTKGRPHSPYADELLAKYRIGTLGKNVR